MLTSDDSWSIRLQAWAKRDGCDDEKTAKIYNGRVEHLTWQCRGKNGTLQHYKVNKGRKCIIPVLDCLSMVIVVPGSMLNILFLQSMLGRP
jgi:hypothetical protein